MLQMPVHGTRTIVQTLEPPALNVTKSGQVRVDMTDGRSLVDVIRDDWRRQECERECEQETVARGDGGKSAVASLPIVPDDYVKPPRQAIAWTRVSVEWEGVTIDRYVLRHSDRLEIPVLHVRRKDAAAHAEARRVVARTARSY